MLVDPLAPKGRAPFLHLPGLLSSCRAVVETKDGRFAFPRNRYLPDDAQASRIGLLVSYYSFEDRHFVPTPDPDEIRLRFAEPEIPFRFSIQDRSGD
ncbi:hypothetical protein [Burkholderia sp. WAC0059]|uniref:hypothetical protein n=1 Tax=Burkholderia sp. WAC0059 TaxID=2066022 RepID=UPI00215583E7|nr:hypothetical protein [Burkholderia sp. WAC0059]